MTLEQQFPNDKATIEWLKSQSKNTRKVYKVLWQKFLEFTKMNGDQILESRKQDKEHNWEKKALEFKNWLAEKEFSEHTVKTTLGIVRGFFNFHYSDLKFRRSTKVKLSRKPKRKRQDFKFTKETIAKMSVQANLRDRYILVVGKSLGLRATDFIGLKIGDFTSLNLDSEAPISMGKIYTQKEAVTSYPFLDSDAVPIVKAFLQSINTSDPDARMLQIKKNELTTVLQRLAKKANIELGNKHLRFHCLRKFLIDRVSATTSESKWKMIVGKTVSEDAYVSELELREAYSRAMPETTFSSYNHSIMKIEQVEEKFKEQIEEQQRRIGELEAKVIQWEGIAGELAIYAKEFKEFYGNKQANEEHKK